jgi:hypothetical protein
MNIKSYIISCVDKAWMWVSEKYQITSPMDYEIKVSKFPTARFAKITYSKKKIRILSNKRFWSTYCLKSVGLYSNRIDCSETECIMLQSVHELTHFAQKILNKKTGEVETTLNEIEYAKEFYPHLYRKLLVIN